MKKFLTLLLLACSLTQVHAKSVVFTLSDGSLVYYLLGGETDPVMRFVDGAVVVNADVYEISDIKSFHVSNTDDPTMVSTSRKASGVSFAGNTFIVQCQASRVRVFTLNGAEVEVGMTESGGYTYVNMGTMPRGAYVVQVGTASFKVMRK